MNLKKFFSELERRKVYRVSIAYGFAAWVLAQIAGLLSESFEAEPWVMQMIITILIIGFPVALVLSWIFDIGPKGLERTQPKDELISQENEPISVKVVIGILVFIILIVMVGNWSWQEFGKSKKTKISSMAILPFDNFTGNDSLEYFVSGIQGSLIGDLQKISALRVPSKTTSNSLKDVSISIPDIAKKLNVDAAVEGSITCMGEDSICVQVRLIRAFPEEQQIWAQDYRIEKSEILNFYSNVTRQISKEIDLVLTPKEENLLAKARIVQPEAYDAYQKGLYYWEKADLQSVNKALDYFQLATELDPEWADPYSGLANVWGLFSFFGYLPKAVTLPKVYTYLNKALELDPNSANAHYVNGIIAVWTEWDWEKGEREFLRSIELDPNDALCRMYYAHLLMILQRSEEANQQAEIGLKLDPLKPLVLSLYGVLERFNNEDLIAAIEYFEKALSVDPNFGWARHMLIDCFMQEAFEIGDYEKWIKLWDKKVGSLGDWNEQGREAVLKSFYEGGHLEAIKEMFRMNKMYDDCYMSSGIKAERYFMLGDIDKAMECLEEDYEKRDPGMPYMGLNWKVRSTINENPRFIELRKKMNLPYY